MTVAGISGHTNFIQGRETLARFCAHILQAYTQPDDKSDVLYQSELGVIGKLLQCLPDWCRISVEGEKGWLHKSALWGVNAAEIYP